MYKCDVVHVTLISFKHIAEFMKQLSDFAIYSFLSCFSFPSRLQEMEIDLQGMGAGPVPSRDSYIPGDERERQIRWNEDLTQEGKQGIHVSRP